MRIYGSFGNKTCLRSTLGTQSMKSITIIHLSVYRALVSVDRSLLGVDRARLCVYKTLLDKKSVTCIYVEWT